MNDFFVPGNVGRARGTSQITYYSCPFSGRQFSTHEAQYEFTLALMLEQGVSLSFTERKRLWKESQERGR